MRSSRAARPRTLKLALGFAPLLLTLGCVASAAVGVLAVPRGLLTCVAYGGLLAGCGALLANRELPLAVSFSCSALAAFVLRSAEAFPGPAAELLVVEVDAEGFDPRYADALARWGADVVRLRGADGEVAEELAETFDYGYVYAPSEGHAIGLYSCYPLTTIDTTYTAGAAVVRVSLSPSESSAPVNLLSVAELPGRLGGIGRSTALPSYADEPTVVFSDYPPDEPLPPAEPAARPEVTCGSPGGERFNRAAQGIFFAGELACTSSVVLRERGIYLGRGATFRSGPPASPLASL